MGSGMWRKVHAVLVASAMVVQAPVAWARLADVDPALHAAVEALVTSDPEVARDPELADLCRNIAEATVTDPRERAAVTGEVVELYREGVDLSTIIPEGVREAAREQYTRMQGEMQREVERIRTTDPERAREMELMMREGERQMVAFETGERYTPSREMVAHAETKMREWEADAIARGAPPEFVERARGDFARWSSGETNPATMMAHAREMMLQGGPQGPGYDTGAAKELAAKLGVDATLNLNDPAVVGQLMRDGKISHDALAQAMAELGQAGAMDGRLGEMARTFFANEGNLMSGRMEGSNYGINPATGGWEPGMGGTTYTGGWETTYTGSWEGSNYGINPATGGWEPNMGGTTYTGGWETTYTGSWEGSNYGINPATGGWEPGMGGTTYTGMETYQAPTENLVYDNTQSQLFQERTEYVNHTGHLVDGDNNPDTPDVVHPHEIHIHTDGTRHDHTTPGSGL